MSLDDGSAQHLAGPIAPTVVVTHHIHDHTRDLLAATCRVIAPRGAESFAPAELHGHLEHADALMVFMPDRIDSAVLNASPRLRVVAGALKGYDQIDVESCTQRGVWVTICEDLLTLPTAELAVGLAVGLLRHIAEGDRRVRAGHSGWRPSLYGGSLVGARVGIYGMGRVGQAIAQLLGGFRCALAYSDPAPLAGEQERQLAVRRLEVVQLLAESDILILAAPLTQESRHAINRDSISRMPPGAVIVNVGRGSVVDEEAVAQALATGRLHGYAADVFAFEDASLLDRPAQIPPTMIAHANHTLFTPHLGSAVGDVRRAIEAEAARNILSALRGECPPGAVNAPKPRPWNAG